MSLMVEAFLSNFLLVGVVKYEQDKTLWSLSRVMEAARVKEAIWIFLCFFSLEWKEWVKMKESFNFPLNSWEFHKLFDEVLLHLDEAT